MCGGMGFVIGLIFYFAWRHSEKDWQRGFAYFCLFWMLLSFVGYCLIFAGV